MQTLCEMEIHSTPNRLKMEVLRNSIALGAFNSLILFSMQQLSNFTVNTGCF